MLVGGAGIPADDTIAAILTGGEIQLSDPATATTAVPLAFGTLPGTLQGNTTSGSTIVSGLSSTSALSVGMLVTGPGIPANDTIITAILAGGEIQLSAPVTATTPVPLAVGTTGSVFQIDAGATVALIGLTISNGNAVQGGGIDNAGTLALIDDTIAGNFANSGGGISNTGALTLINCSVNGNTSISGDQISGPGTITGTANVGPVTPIISSLQPVNITYGTALDNSQLNAPPHGPLAVFPAL